MSAELLVMAAHRADCVFGGGFFRVHLADGGVRYCQTQREVSQLAGMIGNGAIRVVERDGHCLDGDRSGDANTPDVVDAEQWLGMPMREAMAAVGLEHEADYARVYRQVEAAVLRRDNREKQGGVRASIVLKRRGARVEDV